MLSVIDRPNPPAVAVLRHRIDRFGFQVGSVGTDIWRPPWRTRLGSSRHVQLAISLRDWRRVRAGTGPAATLRCQRRASRGSFKLCRAASAGRVPRGIQGPRHSGAVGGRTGSRLVHTHGERPYPSVEVRSRPPRRIASQTDGSRPYHVPEIRSRVASAKARY